MPRGPRLDSPGALHHVIVRGIERRSIFRSQHDRELFLDRLADLVRESGAGLYAWALMPNHAHLLVRTGELPLSRLMHAWLSSYGTAFNRRYRRSGHLFQNRFKSTLVEEEPYLLQLLAYIHLNPVRSRLPVTVDSLDRYPWTGHAVLLGNRAYPAQDCDFVLALFDSSVGQARRLYREFVRAGATADEGDLEGGGLRRSAGGWQRLERLRRGREDWEFDERVLGSTNFVRQVIGQTDDLAPRRADPVAVIPALVEAACRRFRLSPEEIGGRSVRTVVLDARAALSYAVVVRCGLSFTVAARHLGLSRRSIGRAIERAQTAGLTDVLSPPGT